MVEAPSLLLAFAAGVVLVAIGVLVLTDELARLNVEVQAFLERLDLNFFRSV